MTIRFGYIVVAGLVGLLGIPAMAGEAGAMSAAAAKQALAGNNMAPGCYNPDGSTCGCDEGGLSITPVDGDRGNDNCTKCEMSHSGSRIDNMRLAHLHDAVDWRPMVASSGCAPCGGGSSGTGSATATAQGLPSLVLGRVHRYRDIHRNGSFGPGVFSFMDTNLILTVGNTTTGSGTIRLFDPRDRIEYVLGDSNSDGVYEDTRLRIAGTIELQNADGTRCIAIPAAVRAVLTATNGVRTTFELVRTANNPASTDRRGRVTALADRNGNAITMTYEFAAQASDADLGSDRAKLLRLTQVTDAYGRSAHFAYAPTPISGNYVVSSITTPDGGVITYEYANPGLGLGQWDIVGLSAVRWPTGEVATFATRLDSETQSIVVSYDDPGAETTHRRKDVYLTTSDFIQPDGSVINRSGRLVRAIFNGAGEVAYANWTGTVPAGSDLAAFSGVGDQVTYYYEGGNRVVAWISRGGFPIAAAAAEGVTPGPNGLPLVATWRRIESYGHNTQKRVTAKTDGLGRKTTWSIATNSGAMLKRTATDGGIDTWERNQFKQPTLHIDPEGRRTVTVYDTAGNWTARTEAAGTPLAATWTRTYDARGQVLSETDPLGRTTDYAYTAAGYLATVTAPPDAVGGPRAVTTYTYDAAGRLIRMRDPRGIETAYAWDVRGRLVVTTYADTSQERTIYGVGADANLPIETIDRNGNRTIFTYDAAGRRVATARYAPQATAPISLETCTYLVGTDREETCTRDGDTTRTVFGDRNRAMARIVSPRFGVELRSEFAYDLNDRRVSATDAYGRRTFEVYDSVGRAVRTVRELVIGGVPAGADLATLARIAGANPPYVIDDRTYDRSGLVLTSTDPRGVVATMSYDTRRRLVAQTVASGTALAATTAWTYDAVGNRLSQTSPAGRVVAWTWTGRNLKATETEGSGAEAATTIYTYTLNAKIASVTDARGATTTYTYGGCCDRLVAIQDPAGFTTSFTYDPVGNRTQVTQQAGILPAILLTTTTAYDARNRVLSVTNPAQEATTYAYIEDAAALPGATGLGLGAGADGSAVRVTDPLGHTVTEIRDGVGRTVRRIDALGNQTTMSYDAVVGGLVATTSTDPLGHTVTAEADGAGRERRQIDAIGAVSTAGFDAVGNQLSSRSAPTAADPNGIGWDAAYDDLGRMTQRLTTRGDAGAVTGWTYDLDGNRLSETDALSATEYSVYDSRSRRIQITDRVGGITRFSYDAVGNLIQISDADNESRGGLGNAAGTTQYAYDARNLLVAETFPQGQQGRTLRVYAYDGARRLVQRQVGVLSGTFSDTATPGAPLTTTGYAYDAASRLITRSYADGANDGFAYDAAGRLTSATSARYATAVARAYDAANRLTTESLAIDGQTYPVGYTYNADSTIDTLTYPQTGSVIDRDYTDRHELALVRRNGVALNSRGYDAAGRLASQTWGNGLTETRSYLPADYAVASIAVPGVTGFTYAYDAVGRKATEASSLQAGQTFGYDAAGRLTNWAAGAATQSWALTKVGDWASTTRDGVIEARTNSAVHEALTVGAAALSYDIQGNLTQDEQGRLLAWDPENRLASASVPGGASYRYDALGRRVAKRVGDLTTYYLPAGAQTVVEIDRVATRPLAAQTGAEADGTLANLAATPVGGGILTPPAAGSDVTRVNFQPAAVAIPTGFLADSGRVSAVRTNGLTYGWSSDRAAAGVYHPNAVPRPAYATGIRMGEATWTYTVPAGRYAVAVVAGDALSTYLTNNLVIGTAPVTDGSPATEPAYEAGNFDGYLQVVTVTGAESISIAPGVDAVDPTLCFVEIVPIPAGLADEAAWLAAQQASLASAVDAMNGATLNPGASTDVVREYIYGSYVDEVVAYVVGQGAQKQVYYPHYNHLYSVAALTSGNAGTVGQVVERYTYDAYGKQKITDAGGNVTRSKSSVGWDRGFTGYVADNETGLLHARARQYSPTLGRFIGRDPVSTRSRNGMWVPSAGGGYINGSSLYAAYFVANALDPSGLATQTCCDSSGNKVTYDDVTHCCENGVVVEKQSVFVVNRSGGARTGTTEGHIDMALPGSGLVGYFGFGNGGSANGIGMGMTGNLNVTPNDWVTGPTARPQYIVGAGVTLPDGRTIPGVLSTICEVKVCPADVAKMNAEVAKLKAKPGTFNIAGNNCATNGCSILGAGGVMPGGISGIDNPQNLLDQLRTQYNANCFVGYTAMDAAGNVQITNAGPAPTGTPPAGVGGGGSSN
jgi:RHS repeat-associated protein